MTDNEYVKHRNKLKKLEKEIKKRDKIISDLKYDNMLLEDKIRCQEEWIERLLEYFNHKSEVTDSTYGNQIRYQVEKIGGLLDILDRVGDIFAEYRNCWF